MLESLTAQGRIRRLLDVNPATRMLPLVRSSPMAKSSSTGGPVRGPAIIQHGLDGKLSDVSELSELPNEDEHAGVNGDALMLSAAPLSDVVLVVHSLQTTSPQRARQHLERRSKVLARELEAKAEAQAQQAGTSVAASSPQGTAGKRQRESGSPAGDVAMAGGESGGDLDGGAAAMDVVEPQPRAAKRGRRTQDRQSASASPPAAVGGGDGNGNGNNGQGRVLRSRTAAPTGPGRRWLRRW